jgi:hypothetical protein
MSHRHLSTLILCCLLAAGAQASPVTWSQIRSGPSQPFYSFTAETPGVSAPPSGAGAAAEAGTPPEFVRLPDGRIVPFGAGVVCAEASSTSDEIVAPRSRRWLIALPFIATGIACAFLCRGGDDPPRTPPNPPNPPTTPPPTEPPPACDNPPCQPPPACDNPPCQPTPTPTPGVTPKPGVTPTPTPGPTPWPTPPVDPTPGPTPGPTPPTPVPEPGTLILVGAGLALAASRRFKKGKGGEE